MQRLVALLIGGAMLTSGAATGAQTLDWKKVDAFGRKSAVTGDVRRYGLPRSDFQVTVDGVTIRPALALGGWIAFKPAHGGTMVMGRSRAPRKRDRFRDEQARKRAGHHCHPQSRVARQSANLLHARGRARRPGPHRRRRPYSIGAEHDADDDQRALRSGSPACD